MAIEISGERGDPRRLVEIAKARKEEAELEARRYGDPVLAFDEVWCVFDRDEHPRFDDARVMARDNGFSLAISNPCVELWLLLHFRDSPGAQDRRDVTRLLRRFLPDYDKRLDFAAVVGGIVDASARAARLAADAADMGESGRNPTTGFYLLTDSIAKVDGP